MFPFNRFWLISPLGSFCCSMPVIKVQYSRRLKKRKNNLVKIFPLILLPVFGELKNISIYSKVLLRSSALKSRIFFFSLEVYVRRNENRKK